MNKKIFNVGEVGLLNLIKKYAPQGQLSDDSAYIEGFNEPLLINTDVLVESIHFNEKTLSPIDIGWKSVAVNLSDLAASGLQRFIGVTISLIVPNSTELDWVEGVYKGINLALEKYGGEILGGDCSRGKEKVISITAIGTLGPLRLHRGNAKAGDSLIATNAHGLSRLGLALLNNEKFEDVEKVGKTLKEKAIESHKRPTPGIDELKVIINCKPKGIPLRAAGTDSSDGLISAIQGICDSSQCSALIESSKLPKRNDWPKGKHWDKWCLFGGEDFEIIISLPTIWANEIVRKLPGSFLIGEMQNGPARIEMDGEIIEIKDNSFNHFN